MKKARTSLNPNGAINSGIWQLWNEFAPQLGQFIRSRVAARATAEDILHDVFVKFQGQLDEFRDPAKIKGWLFQIGRAHV